MSCPTRLRPVLPALLAVFCLATFAAASPKHVVRTFTYRGKRVAMIIVPSSPPKFRMPAVKAPLPQPSKGINTIAQVPTSKWAFGCSATSAAMMFGHYDRIAGYGNMYAGPTNGGVFPLDTSAWPDVTINGELLSQNPLSATRDGVDGRVGRGHVDDYWVQYGSAADDPYLTGGWTQHAHADCTGDFMGTNQSATGASDGATVFYNYTDGSLLEDFDYYEPDSRDGCHGMRLFAESRGYRVLRNYSQYIYGYDGNTLGFTFANYCAEIDAGRPVLIQVDGHTMLGIGYDTVGNTVYLHDTWDWAVHTMTWGTSYAGMAHYGVVVMQVEPPATPTVPPALTIGPVTPTCLDTTLDADASGSTDGNGTTPTYRYEWSKCIGSTAPGRASKIAGRASASKALVWDAWGHASTDGVLSGETFARGDIWRVHACATDGELTSAWSAPVEITIANALPTAPTSLVISPATPKFGDSLSATATGGSDPDGDPTTYHYQWRLAGDAWGYDSADGALSASVLKGQVWQVRACLNDGTGDGAWTEDEVTVGNTAPSLPATLVIAPTPANCTSTLHADAGGATDADAADTPTYRYQWSKQTAPDPVSGRRRVKATWTAWGYDSTDGVLTGVTLLRGDIWRVQAAADDGTDVSAWSTPVEITIGNAPPPGPTVVVTPSDPTTIASLSASVNSVDADGDSVSYEIQWACWTEGGGWGAWGNDGATIDAALTTRGEKWKAQARAYDGTDYSSWVESAEVTILNAVPTAPATLTINPQQPTDFNNLTPALTPATDDDGDTLTYRYQWSRSADGGNSWSEWDWTTKVLSAAATARGDLWRVRCRAWDGYIGGKWRISDPVEIMNTRPKPPTSVVISPPFPEPDSTLSAAAEGGSDPNGDSFTYEYQWHRSKDAGVHWSAWSWTGDVLRYPETLRGQVWQVRVRTNDGTDVSGWTMSDPVVIYPPRSGRLTVAAVAAGNARGAELTVNLSAAADVQVTVRTLAGRPVAVLPSQALPAGVSRLLWDGRNAAGTVAPAGLYLVEVTAGSGEGLQSRSIAMLSLTR